LPCLSVCGSVTASSRFPRSQTGNGVGGCGRARACLRGVSVSVGGVRTKGSLSSLTSDSRRNVQGRASGQDSQDLPSGSCQVIARSRTQCTTENPHGQFFWHSPLDPFERSSGGHPGPTAQSNPPVCSPLGLSNHPFIPSTLAPQHPGSAQDLDETCPSRQGWMPEPLNWFSPQGQNTSGPGSSPAPAPLTELFWAASRITHPKVSRFAPLRLRLSCLSATRPLL
jgi:hypothetical protein